MSGWTAGSALRRARELQRAEGARTAWFAALGELGYRRLVLLERRLDAPPAPPTAGAALEVAPLAPADCEEYAAARGDGSPAEALRRLRRGERCSVGRLDGAIVTSSWVAFDRAYVEYLDMELELAHGEAYHYDAWTEPALRGAGLASHRLAAQLADLRERGTRAVLATALPENCAGFAPLDRAGFRAVGTLARVRVPGVERHVRREELPMPLSPPPPPQRALLRVRSELSLLRGGRGVVTRAQWGSSRRAPFRPRGPLTGIVVHHTAVRAAHLHGRGVRAEAVHMRDLQRLYSRRGWEDIGYHYVVMPSGRVFAGRPEAALGAHVLGHNRGTAAVALAGDFDVERPTGPALAALGELVRHFEGQAPGVPVTTHRDLDPSTSCPGRFLHPEVPARGAPVVLAAPAQAARS